MCAAVFAVAVPVNVSSEAVEIEWVQQFGCGRPSDEFAQSVDSDGNVYVAGQTEGTFPGQTSSGGYDAFVRKYDASGTEQWTRQFGTTGVDFASGIAVDPGGYLYVIGYTYGTFPGQTRVGGYDAFMRKYDASGTEQWTRQFGTSTTDYAYGVAADSSYVYVGGYTRGTFPGQTKVGGYDAFVCQYESDGDPGWSRQFGTTNDDFGYGTAVDSSGVYVAGYTGGTLPGQTSSGGFDPFVRKYDASGTEQWTRQFGTSSTDYGRDIAADSTGIYFVGHTSGTLPGQTKVGGTDAFVRKYDASGNEQWTRQFGTTSSDTTWSIAVDSSGVYVTGQTVGTFPGQTKVGAWDAFVCKYDVSGTEQWARQFGTTSSDYAFGIAVDSSGVYVAGYTYGIFPGQTDPELGGRDVFVCKYDASGTEQWTRQFGSLQPGYDYGSAIDADGNVYVAGYTNGILPGQTSSGGYDGFVRKYDASGTEQWTRQFGTTSSDYARGVAVDSSGVYVAGYTYGTFPGQTKVGGYDAFVVKYDTSGTEQWTRQFGTTSSDYARGVAVDSSGVYVAGYTYGTFPGQTRVGGYDAFVCKYDASGTEQWARQFGTTSTDQAYGIAVDSSGVYVAGYTYGTLPGQTKVGGYDAFVRQYDASGNAGWTLQFGTSSSDYIYGVAVDSSGVYVAGRTSGIFPGQTKVGGYDAFVTRIHKTLGSHQWTRQFGTTSTDYAYGVAADSSGVYIAGHTYGIFPGQTRVGGMDAFVRKYTSNGVVAWTHQFGTTSNDYGYGVAVDSSSYYVVGHTYGAFGQNTPQFYDVFVAKLFKPPNRPPVADAGGPYESYEGSTVWFNAWGSSDPDGDQLQYRWDLDGDGTWDTERSTISYLSQTYADDYSGTIVVEVYDGEFTDTDSATVTINNADPGAWILIGVGMSENYMLATSTIGGIYYITVGSDGSLGSPEMIDQKSQYCYGAGMGDFDNDGDLDALMGDSSNTWYYEKTGPGNSFAQGVSIDPTYHLYRMDFAEADYNGDGNLDAIMAAYLSDYFTLYLGNGDGTFTRSTISGPNQVIGMDAADFNGDGNMDFAAASWNYGPEGGVYIYLGNGDGSFQLQEFLPGQAWGVSAGDFNNDGDCDLVAGYYSSVLKFYPGNGDGTFGTPVENQNIYPYSLGESDINGDGNLDIVYARGSNYVEYALGNGDGTFTYGGQSPSSSYYGLFSIAISPDQQLPSEVYEGDIIPFTARFSDSGWLDTHTATWDCGDGSPVESGTVTEENNEPMATGEVTGSHAYGDNGEYTLTLTVTDDDSGSNSDTETVTVLNAAPTITSMSGPIDPVNINDPVVINGDFTDPGWLDTHTATIYWDDGESTPGLIDEDGGSGTVTGSHYYETPGVYCISLEVTDDDLDSDTKTLDYYIVVYDPSGGFVTGGGWIDSPLGAYRPDPTLTGKANFGFVAKYKNGATEPTGKTEFQFKAGDLNFHSDTYDWLVVAGAKAKFKGTGTINGAGEYKFKLTAIDGDIPGGGGADKFRIKIWWEEIVGDITIEHVIYDNGEDINGEEILTELGGGSIVIHKGK
jgi:uncharacterized protein (UPF0548 family)